MNALYPYMYLVVIASYMLYGVFAEQAHKSRLSLVLTVLCYIGGTFPTLIWTVYFN